MSLFSLYVGVSCLLITLLALNVSRVRIVEKVRHGDGGNKKLRKAVGAHANALEHMIPFALMVFVLQEQGVSHAVLKVLVSGFLVLRLFHAFGMIFSYYRVWLIAAGLSFFMSLYAGILIVTTYYQ